MTKIKDLTSVLEQFAPLAYQESYDNCGLLTGSSETEVKAVLIALDVTEEVVDEAIKKGCDLIIAHHPIIFKGLKKLTGSNYVERTLIKALKNDIAIYAIHTNLDNVMGGVNSKICQKLGLKNTSVLVPKTHQLKKLITFIPVEKTEEVLKVIYHAGAGQIGNYSECSFRVEGTGSFKPNEAAYPAIGSANKVEFVKENRVEVIFPGYLESKVISALIKAHPYEEPAFDLNLLENNNKGIGSGMIGELEPALDETAFLHYLKERMGLKVIKHTKLLGRKISKVAVCGGAGSFLLKNAVKAEAQVFISSDFKYHEFFDAENDIIIADIGHYESEVYTKELIYELLIQKFSNIALVLSVSNTNPISYL
ncbi:MAG TPA: Nif3-like dinuclear metal center hexameric protein [Cytophagaceae bacterium]|jgi:dinuclear metal center YbgI/SA1388 family protein|nr:Nif3-like dinuclear metal center hexameric protein [Cytophagaceae bacterium]